MPAKKTGSASASGAKTTRKKSTTRASSSRSTKKKTTTRSAAAKSADGEVKKKTTRRRATTADTNEGAETTPRRRTRAASSDADAAPARRESSSDSEETPRRRRRAASAESNGATTESAQRGESENRGRSRRSSPRSRNRNSADGNRSGDGRSSRGAGGRGGNRSSRGNSSRGNSRSGNRNGNTRSGNVARDYGEGTRSAQGRGGDGRSSGGRGRPAGSRGRQDQRGGGRRNDNRRGRGDDRRRGGRRGGRRRELLDSLKLLQRGISVDPYERLRLETTPDNFSTRVFDLVAPIGRGQRCLITSPPKAGKTMLLMAVAEAIIKNHPDVEVVCLLVDERPEEVTFFRRGVDCTVVASSNDMTPADHVRTAEEAIVQVAETVADGKDVVLLLDSITRLARAYNIHSEGSGRTLSGGIDASTMYGPRRIFGAARKIENGGSLTILGTALVDTGSRMDEVIFQEFKGTGNTEVILSRPLAEKRIYPAIDIISSGSRKEEKLYSPDEVRALYTLRRFLADRKPDEAMLGLIKMMERYPTNREVLEAIAGGVS